MNQLFEARMKTSVTMVEEELARRFERVEEPFQPVLDAMTYSLLSGGKRIRGVLVLAFYGLLCEDARPALPFAAAMEMVHAYSLIHDDLPCMDDDDTRRGKPACHIAHGESTALLAGDALQTLAFETCLCNTDFPPNKVRRAALMLARSAGVDGMVGGQVMDLANEDKALTAAELDAINDRKTGALFRAACCIGGILGGMDEEQLRLAEEYAAHIGRAFQITDDLLDVTADPALLGKPVGSDAENHKHTYAAIFGVERCKKLVSERMERAKLALAPFGLRAEFLCELADMLAGREY